MNSQTHTTGRVLLADDHADSRVLLVDLFEGEGYQVHVVRRGPDLLQAVRDLGADAIVLGTGSHIASVIEDLKQLAQTEYRNIPILLVRMNDELSFDEAVALQEMGTKVNVRNCVLASDIYSIIEFAERFCHKPELVAWLDFSRKVQPLARPYRPWNTTYNPSTNAIRAYLAFSLVVLVGLSGLGAILSQEGMIVFEKILPMLMLSTGFFFGRQG